jgi:hypothetical protein
MSQTPDYDSQHTEELPGIRPNPSAAKTMGTLNIIFGAGLFLIGMCCGVYFVSISAFSSAFAPQQQMQMQQAMQAQRQQQLQRLKDQEKAAKTAQEKAKLQAEQKRIEAQPLPEMPDFTKMYAMDEPHVMRFWTVEILSGLILNVLMLIAGIGLVAIKNWGRALGIWVALLKVVRLAALYTFNIVVLVPIYTQRFVDVMEEMAKAMAAQGGAGAGGPPPGGQFAQVMGTMMTTSAVSMIVLGAIYPVTALIVLTRPSVKAACRMPATTMDE